MVFVCCLVCCLFVEVFWNNQSQLILLWPVGCVFGSAALRVCFLEVQVVTSIWSLDLLEKQNWNFLKHFEIFCYYLAALVPTKLHLMFLPSSLPTPKQKITPNQQTLPQET
jgi:hypothetical protein